MRLRALLRRRAGDAGAVHGEGPMHAAEEFFAASAGVPSDAFVTEENVDLVKQTLPVAAAPVVLELGPLDAREDLREHGALADGNKIVAAPEVDGVLFIHAPTAIVAAADIGIDGIVVSNHGGRQLDGVPSTARALPAIAEAVSDRLTILADGGVRSGLDVVRLIALGARGVRTDTRARVRRAT